MHAVEFETDVRNGVIQIPQKYQAEFTAHIKVIVLKESPDIQDSTHDLQGLEHAMDFDAIALDTTQWKFRRSDIYERAESV